MKIRTYIKPITSAGPFGWVVLRLSWWASFWDDRRRFGARVAMMNLRQLWRA